MYKKRIMIPWLWILCMLFVSGFFQVAMAIDINWTGAGDAFDGISGDDGDFRTMQNWSPVRVPDDDDSAWFDLASTYRVFFSRDHSTINGYIQRGKVTIRGTHTYTLAGDMTISSELTLFDGLDLSVGDDLSLQAGTMEINSGSDVTTNDLLVASSDDATVNVDGGALTVDATTRIGSAGGYTGTINIDNGGRADFMGTLNLGGVGLTGQVGHLNIYDGSSVTANTIDIGTSRQLGCSGNILIDGAGASLQTGNSRVINVGASGTSFGSMTIEDSGSFTSGLSNTVNVNPTGSIINHGDFVLNGDLNVEGLLQTSRPVSVTNYDQGAGGTLDITIGGTAPGEYGAIDAGKSIFLAGSLEVTLVDGFIPASGDEFDLLNWTFIQSGTFSMITLPQISALSIGWDISDLYSTGELLVVPLQFPISESKLLASDGSENHHFGYEVSISGDVALVGAPQDDDNGHYSGSAYVYRLDGNSWVQEQKLLASDGAALQNFGQSVAISGNVALVGATRDNENGTDSGAVYVYRLNGNSWVQEQKLLAADGVAYDNFGFSVSICGNVAVVGILNNEDVGGTYVYRWNGNSWVQEQKIVAPDGATDDRFGLSVNIDDDTILVGANADDDVVVDSGSVYVFRWNGSSWLLEQKLIASDGKVEGYFGRSVSISGDLALIGAVGDSTNGSWSGSAYIFRRTGSSWVQEQKLVAADNTAYDLFGFSVSISGNIALVGSAGKDVNGSGSGAAYTFLWSGSSWEQVGAGGSR